MDFLASPMISPTFPEVESIVRWATFFKSLHKGGPNNVYNETKAKAKANCTTS